jgi:hypothetical protein
MKCLPKFDEFTNLLGQSLCRRRAVSSTASRTPGK